MEQQKGLIKRIAHANKIIFSRANGRARRCVRVTGASCIGNIIVATGKLLIGVFSLSLFTCVSAFYTFGMVLAKSCAIAGIYKTENAKEQYKYYIFSGIILISTSVLYMAYSVRLFFYPSENVYHIYVAIGIATFTFFELAMNIRGVIITRRQHTPLLHAIKMINLASSLICRVLTQTAILSFADTAGSTVHSRANGIMGVAMGAAATAIGAAMLAHIKKTKGKGLL